MFQIDPGPKKVCYFVHFAEYKRSEVPILNFFFSFFLQVPVKIHLTFPSKFAGPLIGKQASNLAHIKKFSGASKIHVFPKDREAPERYIEIIGTPLQQYFVSLLWIV